MFESINQRHKIIFRVHRDLVGGIDCGDDAATWFQAYTKMEGVRLVQFLSTETARTTTVKNPFMVQLRKSYPVRLLYLSYKVPSHLIM